MKFSDNMFCTSCDKHRCHCACGCNACKYNENSRKIEEMIESRGGRLHLLQDAIDDCDLPEHKHERDVASTILELAKRLSGMEQAKAICRGFDAIRGIPSLMAQVAIKLSKGCDYYGWERKSVISMLSFAMSANKSANKSQLREIRAFLMAAE